MSRMHLSSPLVLDYESENNQISRFKYNKNNKNKHRTLYCYKNTINIILLNIASNFSFSMTSASTSQDPQLWKMPSKDFSERKPSAKTIPINVKDAIDFPKPQNNFRLSNVSLSPKFELIHLVPNILTFHLKRFTNFGRKIGRYIRYPPEIDMRNFITRG